MFDRRWRRAGIVAIQGVSLALALVTAACGSAPSLSAPSPTPGEAVFNPTSGAYQLTLAMATSGERCGPSGCFSTSLCVSLSNAMPPGPVTAPVHLDRSGDDLTIRSDVGAGTLVMQLHLSGSDVSGSASGSLRSGATELLVGFPPQTALPVTGRLTATQVTGTLDGQVGSAAYSCSNNGHTWSLAAR